VLFLSCSSKTFELPVWSLSIDRHTAGGPLFCVWLGWRGGVSKQPT
jgi:hypothetical protein